MMEKTIRRRGCTGRRGRGPLLLASVLLFSATQAVAQAGNPVTADLLNAAVWMHESGAPLEASPVNRGGSRARPCRAGRAAPHPLRNTSEPPSAVTRTLSPATNSPARIFCASGFSTCCWIARFSGRAP